MIAPLGGFFLSVLLVPAWAAPSAVPAPAAYRAALSRHALTADGLKELGFAFSGGRCFRTDASGRIVPPGLTPAELDAALDDKGSAPVRSKNEKTPHALPADLALDPAPKALGPLYDGSAVAKSPDAGSVAAPGARKETAAPSAPLEPPFDDSWTRIAADIRSPKRRARGLSALSGRFAAKGEEGAKPELLPDAPEALRLLAKIVSERAGGKAAVAELRRELRAVAAQEPAAKADFARRLKSPLTVYVALSRSDASAAHFLDSQLYFRRMEALLAADGLTLSAFIRQADPDGRDAPAFLLSAHAYDALIPYLKRRPAEAGALAPLLFPDRPEEIRRRASQLEGLITQLAAQGAKSGALASFLEGLEDRAEGSSDATALRIAAFLKVNERILPRASRPRIDALAARLPAELEASGLILPEPNDAWPADRWTFVLQFASTDSFKSWASRASARGYARETDAAGITVARSFGDLKVRLQGRLYPGDKEGFIRDSVKDRFLHDAARDLRDPAVQGVILRNHKQFQIASLFGKGVTPGKLVLDGACRSAWDLQLLRRKCPTCSFIVNTGTGHTHANNDAVFAVIEGLASGEEWGEIGDEWAKLSPASARIQGPWTPPYAETLAVLEKLENGPQRKRK